MGQSVVNRALQYLGTPYAWAGGSPSGPTTGVCAAGAAKHDCQLTGFDCSGLALYAWAPYRRLPHYSGAQHTAAGRFHPTQDELQPGDLLFFSAGGPTIDHVVIYAGAGTVVQAPESGHVVEVSQLAQVLSLEPRYLGATRPASTGREGAAPRITSLSVAAGAAAGGETITLHGTNLATTSRVRFGTVATYSFTVVSDSEIQVQVPAGRPGTVPVRLGNAWGVSPTTAAARFTYAAS